MHKKKYFSTEANTLFDCENVTHAAIESVCMNLDASTCVLHIVHILTPFFIPLSTRRRRSPSYFSLYCFHSTFHHSFQSIE